MENHPLVKAYRKFVANRTPHAIGFIGQPDAGKSSLINQLLPKAKAYTGVHTDATLTAQSYLHPVFGELVDFPGVGTEEITLAHYKKIIKTSAVQYFYYILSSKIRETDMELINYLAKEGKEIQFVYNKVDALVDVNHTESKELLRHTKNTELKVMLRGALKEQKDYLFTSALTGEGIETLREQIDQQMAEMYEAYLKHYRSEEMKESYLNYKVNSVFPKLFTPALKEVLSHQNYTTLERTIRSHFRVEADDVYDKFHQWPSIEKHVEEIEQQGSSLTKMMDMTKVIQMVRSAFKLKSINPIQMAVSSLFEAGMAQALPAVQAMIYYTNDMKEVAKHILDKSTPLYR
ncbi:GTPase domain-containing protein [Macrococcus brunensis]|uniref:GTPase domain-containing protein n=1 Tax=Macrococcus brunensis TaxID=198483 RepID=UPI001EF01526|nr:GTPase domain-containing protein [Macrococcus brunensis]ULG72121.1 GTPase domain-containing protein [Macrococcus brunensis]